MSPLETSLPSVFAIGDVRAGSVKRVASAVGEGAQVVAAVHRTLRVQRLSRGGGIREVASTFSAAKLCGG